MPPVTVHLLRDGKPFRTITIEGGSLEGSFDGVPKASADGRGYTYTVSSNTVPGFTLVGITGSAEAGFVITNRAGEHDGMLNVRFIDWNGVEIDAQQVPFGGSAKPPKDPVREGYVFAGWAGSYQNITRNAYVYAQYDRMAPNGEFGGDYIFDAMLPLAGGAVSNFGDCVE